MHVHVYAMCTVCVCVCVCVCMCEVFVIYVICMMTAPHRDTLFKLNAMPTSLALQANKEWESTENKFSLHIACADENNNTDAEMRCSLIFGMKQPLKNKKNVLSPGCPLTITARKPSSTLRSDSALTSLARHSWDCFNIKKWGRFTTKRVEAGNRPYKDTLLFFLFRPAAP